MAATSAFEIPGLRFSLVSDTNNIKRHRFLSVVPNNGTVSLANDTSAVVGVSMNQVDAANRPVEIADGIVIVEVASAVNAGSYVVSDNNGMAVASGNSGADASNYLALTTADNAGQFISVKMF